jgi:hypothetical protein
VQKRLQKDLGLQPPGISRTGKTKSMRAAAAEALRKKKALFGFPLFHDPFLCKWDNST